MAVLSPNVNNIKTTLDTLYPVEKKRGLHVIVDTVNSIIATLHLTQAEYYEVVEVTKNKLQELLTDSGLVSKDLWTLHLYPDGERQTKIIRFLNSKKKVEMREWHSITPDPEETKKMNEFMEQRRREYIVKNARSEQSAENMIINT